MEVAYVNLALYMINGKYKVLNHFLIVIIYLFISTPLSIIISSENEAIMIRAIESALKSVGFLWALPRSWGRILC